MRKLLLFVMCLMMVTAVTFMVTSVTLAQDSAQSDTQNKMYLDPYHCWKLGAAANTSDSLIIKYGGNDHTDPFRHWENSVIQMYVVGADSVKFFVDLMQYSYAPTSTAADTAKYVIGRTLTWSGKDSTAIDTIETAGYYMATLSRAIDDTTSYASLWDLIRVRPITGNTKETGNHAIFVVTGREAVTKQEAWKR